MGRRQLVRLVTSRLGRVIPTLARLVEERDAARHEVDRLGRRLKQARRRAEKAETQLAVHRQRLERRRRALEIRDYTIASLKDELAARRSADTSSAEPAPDLRYLFVMTYGRSGSTLLQAILNSIPGVLIRGENGGVVPHLQRFHAGALHERATRPSADSPASAYFGINDYPADDAPALFRELLTRTLLRPGPDTRTVGYKEIRWYMPDLQEHVDFLRHVFPGARFVVNTRRLADVAKSQWWAVHDDSEQRLEEIEAAMLAVARGLGEDAFHVVYDDYVADARALEPLFAWLGADFDLAAVQQLMQIRFSSPEGNRYLDRTR